MPNDKRTKTTYSLTPASTNKLLKQFKEKLNYLYGKEQKLSSYILITGEEPVKPDYDLEAFRKNIGSIMDNTLILKHAVNTFNTSTLVGQTGLTVDQVLVKMAMWSTTWQTSAPRWRSATTSSSTRRLLRCSLPWTA